MNLPIDSDLKRKRERGNDETKPSAANQYDESLLEVEDLVKTSNDNQKKKKTRITRKQIIAIHGTASTVVVARAPQGCTMIAASSTATAVADDDNDDNDDDDDDDDDGEFGQEDTKKKWGMPKGTIKHMKHKKDDWYHAVKLYKDKYEDDDDMNQIDFLCDILSWGKAGRISKSETNRFSKKYMAYCNGDLKKPRGYDERNANTTIEAAASVQTTRDTFNARLARVEAVESLNFQTRQREARMEVERAERERIAKVKQAERKAERERIAKVKQAEREEVKWIFNLPEDERTPEEKKLLADNPFRTIDMTPAQWKEIWRQLTPKQTTELMI